MCFALKRILLRFDLVKEKVAVATVEGKAYFLIVNALREQNIPFVSLVPGKPASAEVKAVITTEKEKDKIKHEKLLIFREENELDSLVNEVKRILQGKDAYEKIVIGIDPGTATGLAVIADGKVIQEGNCFSIKEVVDSITKIIRNINLAITGVYVKIGKGVPIYREILQALDGALPIQVELEVVNEAGTNRPIKENRRSRRIRHISSAKRIAGRTGDIITRSNAIATNS
jgi:hypothetical protein